MRKTLTINIDEDLLTYTANCFNYHENIDYSQLIERVLFYFLNPQTSNKLPNSIIDKEIDSLLREPQIDINTIEKDYSFNFTSVEGKWPGDESIEKLIQMLSQ